MTGERILVVDDDPNILELVRLYLEKDGYVVALCTRGDLALAEIERVSPALVVLDLMLPGKSGFDILRELRQQSSFLPVIMLTARGDTLDKVVGLELGADDYVEKPFEPKELVARVKAVLRRATATPIADKEQIVRYSDLIVDLTRFEVRLADLLLEMAPRELELLHFLASHPNRVFTREQILDRLWGKDYFGEIRTVDVHVKRIREKLDLRPHPDWRLRTVWGVGYKFETQGDPLP